jgi:hypothetical protein
MNVRQGIDVTLNFVELTELLSVVLLDQAEYVIWRSVMPSNTL